MDSLNLRKLIEKETLSDLEYIKWLQELHLISDRYRCPTCLVEMTLGMRTSSTEGYLWRCHKCKKCRSIRSGSWFGRSKLTLKNIMLLSYMWCERISQKQIRKELGFGTSTVVDWFKFCRECACMIVEEDCERLGGPGKIVEIDESLFRKKQFKKGEIHHKQWVFGGVEQGSNKCFFRKVNDRDAKTFIAIIQKYILPGTTIHSNSWKAKLLLGEKGFNHLRSNYKITFKDGESTDTIKGMWNDLRGIFPECNRKKLFFESYLGEYVFRKSYSSQDLFNVFLEKIILVCKPKSSDSDGEDNNEDVGEVNSCLFSVTP